MKKLITTLLASLFMFAQANADFVVGVTANFATVDTSGTETLRDSGKKTKGSHKEDVDVPEIFFEAVGERGALGIAYVPTQAMGTKSRSDTTTTGDAQDTGTYTAKAELDSHVMIYGDLNLMNIAGQQTYFKLGLSHAGITTLESLNSGSTYSNDDVMGTTVGLGVRGDLYGSTFYKLEGTYTEYDTYEDSSENATTANKITADTEITSVKLSVGYKF